MRWGWFGRRNPEGGGGGGSWLGCCLLAILPACSTPPPLSLSLALSLPLPLPLSFSLSFHLCHRSCTSMVYSKVPLPINAFGRLFQFINSDFSSAWNPFWPAPPPSPTGEKRTCGSVTYGLRPIIAALPAWFRFAQCLRRYRDTREANPHLVNAGKYSTTFFVVLFSSLSSAEKGEERYRLIGATWFLTVSVFFFFSNIRNQQILWSEWFRVFSSSNW